MRVASIFSLLAAAVVAQDDAAEDPNTQTPMVQPDWNRHPNTTCTQVGPPDNQQEVCIPVLQLIGSTTIRLDVQDDKEFYLDQGATCWDKKEGFINLNVVVSGSTVNVARPGRYVTSYECENGMGAPATIVSRTVIVSAFFKPGALRTHQH